jgi:anaerobic selenocysteine-containing dehydrogenase
MKRRDFLKSSLMIAAVSTVVGKTAGLFNEALASVTWVTAGKLGYKEVSPQKDKGKLCSTCKHFKDDKKQKDAGLCTLPAMKNAMKNKDGDVYVKSGAYCNMWAKKA